MTKTSNSHGTMGMADILTHVCQKMRRGTCQGADRGGDGTIEQTFGRLYNPSTIQPDEAALREVAARMMDDPGIPDGPADAGTAFLGQFIDHDLTLDAMTKLSEVAGDVSKIRNFRTPRLDLDCVYGNGREVTPYLYHGDDPAADRGKMIFGRTKGQGTDTENPLDLQRNRLGRALIGDPRNDENLFVSQVHGRKFVDEHNKHAASIGGTGEERYDYGKEQMLLAYHTMIIHDFLPQVVHENVLGPIMACAQSAAAKNQDYLDTFANIDWRRAPDMPVEFSAAAFRFGHAMIRDTYKLNGNPGRDQVPIFAQQGDADTVDLRGFSPVDEANNLDMDLFFGPQAQRARAIDTHLPTPLLNLPQEVVPDNNNLAFRNMQRGQNTFQLPSGEVVAGNMGFDTIEPNPKLGNLIGNTPLWFYILAEAEQSGGKLGNVGGTLVAGVLLNLMLRGDSPYFFPKHHGAIA